MNTQEINEARAALTERRHARLRGRLGAFALHAKYDARETTKKAREVFMSRWDQEVDPNNVLEPTERQRRAEAAKRAYFARLAYRSALKRAKHGRRDGTR